MCMKLRHDARVCPRAERRISHPRESPDSTLVPPRLRFSACPSPSSRLRPSLLPALPVEVSLFPLPSFFLSGFCSLLIPRFAVAISLSLPLSFPSRRSSCPSLSLFVSSRATIRPIAPVAAKYRAASGAIARAATRPCAFLIPLPLRRAADEIRRVTIIKNPSLTTFRLAPRRIGRGRVRRGAPR